MNSWSTYWLWWAAITFLAFIVPETVALITRHPENTLSAQVWKLEDLHPGEQLWQWTAAHVLIGGVIAVLLLWLLLHFVLGIWR